MKLPALLLAASLAANAALLFLYCGRGHPTPLPPPASIPTPVALSLHAHPSTLNASTSLPLGLTPRTWSALDTPDLRQLIARLRATGFSPSVIRAIIQARLNNHRTERTLELEASFADGPFWKAEPRYPYTYDPERGAAYRTLHREQAQLRRELLTGLDPAADAAELSDRRRAYGELPPEKLDQLQRLDADYQDLRSQITESFRGVILPEDRAQMELLAREKRADLARILSPAELDEYDRRTSPFLLNTLNRVLTAMDASEAEFRTIAKIQQPYAEAIHSNLSNATPADRDQRITAQQALDAQLKIALGDARYADYVRAKNGEFQQLVQLAVQADLPATTAKQTFAFRDTVAQESSRIYAATDLTYDQKRAALTALAQNTRAQLTATLGATAAPAYLKTADRWLSILEKGGSVSFTTTGPQASLLQAPPKP